MKILITGFDPFNGENVNPATEVLKLLPNDVDGNNILKLQLPTVFYKSLKVLFSELEKEKPDIVISLGQAGGRTDITIERVAININDARIPDNEGNQPIDEDIYKDGPAAYFSTLPIKGITKEINLMGIASSVSNTAGTFVCNHVMYGLLHYCCTNNLLTKGGFIHIPYIPSQVEGKENTPSMELETIVKGIIIAIRATIKYIDGDIIAEGGKIS